MGNLRIAGFQKNRLYIGLGFLVLFVFLTIAVAPMILASVSESPKTSTDSSIDVSEKDFPLQLDLSKNVFWVGEKIVFNATIINRSGIDVNVLSNGAMPCAYFHNVNDNTTHGETTEGVNQVLKANDNMSRVFEFSASEKGTYVLDAHYLIRVNGVWIQEKVDDIIVEVR